MQVRVVGSNMDIGQALTSYVEEHLAKTVTKYFDKAIDAEVHFSKDGNMFRVIVIVNEGVKGGIVVKSNAEAGDVYACFNEACSKSAKQLNRYKSKIKNQVEKYYKKMGASKKFNFQSWARREQKITPQHMHDM